jgi:hypothetical protein
VTGAGSSGGGSTQYTLARRLSEMTGNEMVPADLVTRLQVIAHREVEEA